MKRNNLLKIFLFIFVMIIFPKNAFAVTFSVNKSADNLKPGNPVTVTINAQVENNAELSGFDLAFTYDASSFDYVNGAGTEGISVNGGNGKITISSTGIVHKQDFTVATLNFNTSKNAKANSSNLSLTATSCTKNESVSCNANGSRITTLALGTDATLKSLKIPNTTLSPAFNKNTLNYNASIADITELTVNAVANDSSSKIQISDNYKNLQKGDNVIKIVVTAENGASKTYTVTVNLSLTPTDEEKLKADATLKELVIKNQTIDFKPEEKKYYLEVPYKTKKLTITPTATNEKAKVEMDSTKLKVGKNTITITVTSEDGANTETYQILVTRAEQKKEIVQTCPDETSTREWIIYSVSMIITFTLGIVLGYFLCKKDVLKKIFKKKEKKKEEPVEVESLSDTIELDTTKVLEKAKKKTKEVKEEKIEEIKD